MANYDYLDRHSILTDFLYKWPIDKVRSMSIEEYVGVRNKNTFCQYLETITRPLGSIKGNNSSKFGIFKRTLNTKSIAGTIDDSEYVWKINYGKTSSKAFKSIKENIIKVIEYASTLDFKAIDDIALPDLLKWEVAFLYSKEAFIPIYSHDALMQIATYLGMPNVKINTKYSEIHKYISNKKPVGVTVYEYMTSLFEWYRLNRNNDKVDNQTASLKECRPTRKGLKTKNTAGHIRKGTGSKTITCCHNDMQNQLSNYFQKLYPTADITLEENNVDVTVKLPDGLILVEVKTDSRAEYCIRQGLGQLLTYSFNEKSPISQLVICGKSEPTDNETKFITYISDLLHPVIFEYLSMSKLLLHTNCTQVEGK